MRPISGIIIHCTATRADWWEGEKTSAKVAEIRRWHVDPPPKGRGWKDIGYHYLIDRDGTVATGRPLDQVGAHVQGHNTGTIGISLFGGHGSSEKDDFTDHFTIPQDKALRGLIAKLEKQFGNLSITGHNEYAAKACPGFTVSDWLDDAMLMNATPGVHSAGKPSLTPVPPKNKGTIIALIIAAIAAAFAWITKG